MVTGAIAIGPFATVVVVGGAGGSDAFGARVFAFGTFAIDRFLVLDLFGELQQRIAFGDLTQLGFQLQLRQLQQTYRLLQLGRQGQLLMEAKLQCGFHASQIEGTRGHPSACPQTRP